MKRARGKALGAVLLAVLALPGAGQAQVWRADSFDNGAWFEAWVSAAEGLPRFHCGGVSPTGLPLPESDEPILTTVGALDLWMPDNGPMLRGLDPPPRTDLRLVTDAQAFALPNAYYDLLYFNGWVQTIGVRDAALGALATSQVWAIDGQHGRWGPFASAGLGQALQAAIAYCEARWNAVPAAPAPPAGDLEALLESARQRDIAETCPRGATVDPTTPLRADLDGDGIADIVQDQAGVRCTGEYLTEHCGAALCSVAVYLSRLYPQRGTPEWFLGGGAHLVQGTDGQVWIGTGGRLADCPQAYDPAGCTFYWRFDGSGISPVRRP